MELGSYFPVSKNLFITKLFCTSNNTLPTILYVFGAIFLIWYVQWHWRRRHLYLAASRISGPRSLPFIGHGIQFAIYGTRAIEVLTSYVEKFGTPICGWLGPKFLVGITDVNDIEKLFNSPAGIEKTFALDFSEVLRNGLLNSPSHIWKKHRKVIQQSFRPQILDTFVSTFAQEAEVLVKCLKHDLEKPTHIFERLFRLSLETICETSLGIKMNNQLTDNKYCHHLQRAIIIVYQRTWNFLLHSDIIYKLTPYNKELKEHNDKIISFSEEVIKAKKREFQEQKEEQAESDSIIESYKIKSFVELLIETSENGSLFSDKDVRDQATTFIIAGSDTTAVTGAFTLLCLALYPEMQELVFKEVSEHLGHDKLIEKQDLSKLEYTERVIKESMRYFPIVPVVLRECKEDLIISNKVRLPTGTHVIVLSFLVHFDPIHWPDPSKFDPNRFLPEISAKRNKYAYLPFAAGQRNCVGKTYAMMSMKTTIATLVRKYKFFTDYKSIDEIKLIIDIVAKPKDGFKLYLKERLPKNVT